MRVKIKAILCRVQQSFTIFFAYKKYLCLEMF